MTDDRNDGGVPPPSEPSAPPPLAAPPPPVAPPQPSPAPSYPPPAPGGGSGKWILFIILAFAAGVGGTILVLWLTGDLWNKQSGYSPTPSYGTTGIGSNDGTPPTTPTQSANARSYEGTAPTPASLQGTWGPNCPASTTQAASFYGDGTMQADGDSGSWTLDGYTLSVRTSRGTEIYRWEMLGNDSAQVTRGSGNPRVVNRCR